MNNFRVYFQTVDHYADDAGVTMPIESTIVVASSANSAIQQFCDSMRGERFEIKEVVQL